ncbi:MAG: hypothetical protein ACLQUY_24490 [Ktedonobacterales bacterium]
MRNERGREPYRQEAAARGSAPDDQGDASAPNQTDDAEDSSRRAVTRESPQLASDPSGMSRVTEADGATPPTEETLTLAVPEFPGRAPLAQPGPRLSSGPLQNQLISYHQSVPPRHEPAWEMPQGPAHGPKPGQLGAIPGARFTHVPWQVSDSWGATTFNISANTAAGASYLFWWVSGFLIYFSERHNRFVRFHALQSVILTGGLTVVGVSAVLFATVMQDLTNATHQPIFYHLGIWGVLLMVLAIVFAWLCVMIAAWTGNYLRIPIIGPYAERYSAPPAEPTRNPLL